MGRWEQHWLRKELDAGSVQMNGNGLRHTVFFHGNAIQYIGKRHGFLVVGDDNELSVGSHFL